MKMTQQAFFFHGERCTGCKTCQLACADYNDLSCDFWYRKIYEYCGGSWSQDGDGCWTSDAFAYYASIACNHCDDPACVEVCPTTAMHKDAETGLVSVDPNRCIGCGYCHMACPYNVPKVDREKGHSVKCDGCASRVAQGQLPICVEACPMHALDFGTADEMRSKGERASFAPLPDASYTNPNLYAINPANAKPCDSGLGKVMNYLEVK